MNAKASAVRSEMLALSDVERAELIIDLLDSLDDRPDDDDQSQLERVWADETARRARQIDAGDVVMHSWDDVTKQVAEARRRR